VTYRLTKQMELFDEAHADAQGLVLVDVGGMGFYLSSLPLQEVSGDWRRPESRKPRACHRFIVGSNTLWPIYANVLPIKDGC